MSDLDQFLLKDIAETGAAYQNTAGKLVVLVPLDLLRRVTDQFDVEHVRRELRGARH